MVFYVCRVENQECKRCPEDYFIADSANPFFICYVCPSSAACPNRGPPQWQSTTVETDLSLAGLSAIDATSELAVQQLIAETLSIDPTQVEVGALSDIGEFAANQDLNNRRSAQPDGDASLVHGAAGRALQQSSTVQVTVRISRDMNGADDLAGYLESSDFEQAMSSTSSELGITSFTASPVPAVPKVDKNKVSAQSPAPCS